MFTSLNPFIKKIFNNIKVLLINPSQSLPILIFSKYFYGNLAGFRQNFFGNFQKFLSRYLGKRYKNRYNSSEMNLVKLKDDGYLKIENAVDINAINEIRKDIKKIEKKKKKKMTFL